jgi:hypothetical protein
MGARQGEIGASGGQETTRRQHKRDKDRRSSSKEDPPTHQIKDKTILITEDDGA